MINKGFDSSPEVKTAIMDRELRRVYPHEPGAGLTLDPLSQLVHSILSQKTTSENTDVAFLKLVNKYRCWEAVRDANLRDLTQLISASTWQEVKAKRIQSSLMQVSRSFHGQLSLDFLHALTDEKASEFLQTLPGVGPKTSAGILLFSTTRRPALPVDTHYHRIAVRLGILPRSLNAEQAHILLRSRLPYSWSANDMEKHYIAVKKHGQWLCRPTEPKCGSCCLRNICDIHRPPRQLSLALFEE
jgi:endonuclease-3